MSSLILRKREQRRGGQPGMLEYLAKAHQHSDPGNGDPALLVSILFVCRMIRTCMNFNFSALNLTCGMFNTVRPRAEYWERKKNIQLKYPCPFSLSLSYRQFAMHLPFVNKQQHRSHASNKSSPHPRSFLPMPMSEDLTLVTRRSIPDLLGRTHENPGCVCGRVRGADGRRGEGGKENHQ